MRVLFFCCATLLGFLLPGVSPAQGPPLQSNNPIRVAIDGLWHPQALTLLADTERNGMELVGIAEDDPRLIEWARTTYDLDPALFFPDLKSMVKSAQPQGVALYDHPAFLLERVRYCARKSIHLLLPPPLFCPIETAEELRSFCEKKGTKVVVNYEEAWWGSTQRMHHIVRKKGQLGTLRKIQFQVGTDPAAFDSLPTGFKSWIQEDPGLGVLYYTADAAAFAHWILDDALLHSVSVVSQKMTGPHSVGYPGQVVVVMSFSTGQLVTEASFMWPAPQRTWSVYGDHGYLAALDARTMRMQTRRNDKDYKMPAPKVKSPYDDPYDYWTAWIKDEVRPDPGELFSLDNFVQVSHWQAAILEAYLSGKTVNPSHH